MTYSTNYRVAAHWCNNSFILCNKVAEDFSIFDNANFDILDTEIFQFFITDCSEGDVEFLSKHFGLLFTYSDDLELWVLCVDHFGTSWDYVHCDTDLEQAQRELGESK